MVSVVLLILFKVVPVFDKDTEYSSIYNYIDSPMFIYKLGFLFKLKIVITCILSLENNQFIHAITNQLYQLFNVNFIFH